MDILHVFCMKIYKFLINIEKNPQSIRTIIRPRDRESNACNASRVIGSWVIHPKKKKVRWKEEITRDDRWKNDSGV